VGFDDIIKRFVNCLWMLTRSMLFVSTKNMFDKIKKRHFLLLSEDTNEKDIFGGQFVSMYF